MLFNGKAKPVQFTCFKLKKIPDEASGILGCPWAMEWVLVFVLSAGVMKDCKEFDYLQVTPTESSDPYPLGMDAGPVRESVDPIPIEFKASTHLEQNGIEV